jgi:myosin-15
MHVMLELDIRSSQCTATFQLQVLVNKIQVTRGEQIKTPLNFKSAHDTRDALAKALYDAQFRWLVQRINSTVATADVHRSISILDIFGFENFEINSFEQFCINYANETLQFYFNKHIFQLEQDVYRKEGINWSKIDFSDNQVPLCKILRFVFVLVSFTVLLLLQQLTPVLSTLDYSRAWT